MLLRRLPVSLLLLVLGVMPGNAQNTPSRRAIFSIGGSVRDESDHHEMENISVTLKLLTGNIVNSVFTRGNGDFEFDGLGNGEYIVEINVRDYERVQQSVTISGASRLGLSFFLARTGKAANPPLQLSISAHQLSVPHKAHDEFEKGMTLIYLKSDYRGAITQFQLAIKDFPTYYEAYAEEGTAYYQLEEMALPRKHCKNRSTSVQASTPTPCSPSLRS